MPVCQSSCTPKTPRVTWEASRTTGARPSSSAVSPRPASRYRDRYKYLCVYLPAGADAGTSTCACTCRLVQVPVQIPVRAPASRCRYQYLYLPLVQVQVQFPAQATPRTAGPSTQPRPTGSLRGRWRAAMPWSVAVTGREVILKKRLLPLEHFLKKALTFKNYLKTA